MALVRADVTRVAVTFVAFEAAWFACVLSAARGDALIGVGAAAAAVALHFALSGQRVTGVMLLVGWGLITSLLIGFARRLEAGRLAHESAPR